MTKTRNAQAAAPGPKPRTAAEIAEAARAMAAEREAATAELERLEAARPALLLEADEATLEDHDNQMARVRRQIDRSAARHAKLLEEHAAAEAAEEQARRQAIYERGEAARAEAEGLICRVYPKAAAEIAEMLHRVDKLRGAIQAANKELPEGATRIRDPEGFRGRAAVPGSTREWQEEYFLYVDPRDPDRKAYEVKPPAYSGPPEKHWRITGQLPQGFSRHTRTKTESTSGSPAWQPERLRCSVSLPGLGHSDADFWDPKR